MVLGPVSKMQFHMLESTARVDFNFIPVLSALVGHFEPRYRRFFRIGADSPTRLDRESRSILGVVGFYRPLFCWAVALPVVLVSPAAASASAMSWRV